MFLSKFKPNKISLKKLRNQKGHNNQGKITVKSWGGGHKKIYRHIPILNKNFKKGIITNIEYDPNRSIFIAKVLTKKDGKNKFFYIQSTSKTNVLQTIKPQLKKTNYAGERKLEDNTFLIKNLSIGDFINNIEKVPNQGPKFARSAGTFGQIIGFKNKSENLVRVQLPSKEHYLIFNDSRVRLGKCSNSFHKYLRKWKAGDSRHIGKRPITRGVAKNPIDHPHGGGEGKSNIGRAPVSPQGRLTQGVPTRRKKQNSFFIALRKRLLTN